MNIPTRVQSNTPVRPRENERESDAHRTDRTRLHSVANLSREKRVKCHGSSQDAGEKHGAFRKELRVHGYDERSHVYLLGLTWSL